MDLARPPLVEDTFAAVAENTPAMLWRGDAQGKCVYLNRAQRAFWGVPDGGIDSFTWASTLVPEDAPLVFGPFSEGMSKQQPFTCEARYLRADGEVRILKTIAEPHFDAGGLFTGMVGVNVDVTEERRAQRELSESEARLRSLADNLPYGMVYQIVVAPDGARRFSVVSEQCKTLNGVDAADAMRDASLLYNMIAPEHRETFAAAEQAAMAGKKAFEADVLFHLPSGAQRWFRIASAPRPLPDGSTVWDGVQVDIHEVKVAEERRLLLMREMGHRIKNNLSTVLSIAVQTGRSAASYDAFRTSFQARLMALAKSHDLLMEGAGDSADLRDILESELLPYATGASSGHALQIAGPSVRFAARGAVGLALVVHELATNAAKYGAYSRADGALSISWSIAEDGRVHLSWRERGGPPTAAPEKVGFGTRLIESVLQAELGGSIAQRFSESGFEADLIFDPAVSERLR